MVISTHEKAERAQKSAFEKLGITSLDQLVAAQYCPHTVADHFSKDLNRLAGLEGSVTRLRPLLESAIEERFQRNPRRHYLTSNDLVRVETRLKRSLGSKSSSPPPSEPASSLRSHSPSRSPSPSPSRSTSAPPLPQPDEVPGPMDQHLRQLAGQRLSEPAPPEQTPIVDSLARKRRRISTVTMVTATAPDSCLPVLQEHLPPEVTDVLDKAADDLREALDGCIKHCAATVETHQRNIEAAAQKATESQRALEQAQSSAQLSPFSDDASAGDGDQLLERRKFDLVQKKERLLQRRDGFLGLPNPDEQQDADGKLYLEALDGKLEAITSEIQSVTETLEAAAKAKEEASAQVARLQGLADDAAAAEEHSRGTLRAAEQVQAFLRQYRVVVDLGPVGAQSVLSDSFKVHHALLDSNRG